MQDDDVEVWAASGAMWLTGRADGHALPPPAPMVPRLSAAAEVIAELTQRLGVLGRPVRVRPVELLGERAALKGLSRRGCEESATTSRWQVTSIAESSTPLLRTARSGSSIAPV